MAHFVGTLRSRLEQYTHPDLDFITVLNDVLPSLASRGIWKDLTFEATIPVTPDQSFLTLPDEADSVLYAMSGNHRVNVNPLWQAYLSEGATRGKLGEWYGVEDAGFISTKDVLEGDSNYVLFAMPLFEEWGNLEEGASVPLTTSPVESGVTIQVSYTNWEGVESTTIDTLSASRDPQILSPRDVSRVSHVSINNVTSTPVMVVAVPCSNYATIRNLSTTFFMESIPGLPSGFTDLDSDILVYPLDGNDTRFTLPLTTTSVSESAMSGTYSGDDIATAIPCAIFTSSDIGDAVVLRTEGTDAEDARRIASCGSESSGQVLRYRAFRIHARGRRVHALYKRKIHPVTSDNDVVPLDNLTALRYAILANTAEHNNDFETAIKWWRAAKAELDRELDSSLGAATPNIQFDPTGGLGAVENPL